jgi:hypothetical protein
MKMNDYMRQSIYRIDAMLACEPDLAASECSSRLLAHARKPALGVPLCEPWWGIYVAYTHGQRILATLSDRLDRQLWLAEHD